jgi:hypothetical protein
MKSVGVFLGSAAVFLGAVSSAHGARPPPKQRVAWDYQARQLPVKQMFADGVADETPIKVLVWARQSDQAGLPVDAVRTLAHQAAALAGEVDTVAEVVPARDPTSESATRAQLREDGCTHLLLARLEPNEGDPKHPAVLELLLQDEAGNTLAERSVRDWMRPPRTAAERAADRVARVEAADAARGNCRRGPLRVERRVVALPSGRGPPTFTSANVLTEGLFRDLDIDDIVLVTEGNAELHDRALQAQEDYAKRAILDWGLFGLGVAAAAWVPLGTLLVLGALLLVGGSVASGVAPVFVFGLLGGAVMLAIAFSVPAFLLGTYLFVAVYEMFALPRLTVSELKRMAEHHNRVCGK